MSARPPSRPLHSTSSISRTLFHSRLSRRPTSSSTSTTATTLVESPPDSSSSEILVRNQNGDYAVTVPTLPAPEDDPAEAEAEAQLDAKEAESMSWHIFFDRPSSCAADWLLWGDPKPKRASLLICH